MYQSSPKILYADESHVIHNRSQNNCVAVGECGPFSVVEGQKKESEEVDIRLWDIT